MTVAVVGTHTHTQIDHPRRVLRDRDGACRNGWLSSFAKWAIAAVPWLGGPGMPGRPWLQT
jgi:hypothetical protein